MSDLYKKINFTNPRWPVFSRLIAAIFAGYALATSSALFIGQLLIQATDEYQAIHIGLMLSFVVYVGAVIWVFSVSSAKRAWLGLISLNVIFLLLTWLLKQVNNS